MNTRKHCWMSFLCEYDFGVHYIKGKENIIVDSLRRRWHEISILSLEVDLWGYILEALPSDTWYQEVRADIDSRCTLEGRFLGYFLDSDGRLRHLGYIYVSTSGNLYISIFLEAHHAPYFAHLGIKKMHLDLRHFLFWVGMRKNKIYFVSRCLECPRMKAKHQHLVDLL